MPPPYVSAFHSLASLEEANVQFTASDENEIAILWEVDDASKFLALVDTQATADAMELDGVKRDTVKIHVLDKAFDL